MRSLAGLELDPHEPGYQHIIFRPRPGGSITSAEASLETSRGRAAISWELGDKEIQLTLTVPQGAQATLSLPKDYDGPASPEVGPGDHRLVFRKRQGTPS